MSFLNQNATPLHPASPGPAPVLEGLSSSPASRQAPFSQPFIPQAGGPSDPPSFNFQVVRSLRMHAKLAVVVGLAVVLLMIALGLKQPRTYTASSVIYVEPMVARNLNEQGVPGFDQFRYGSFLDQQIQTIVRPDVLTAALRTLPAGTWRGPLESEQSAVARLSKALTVERVLTSYQITVQLKASSPEAAAAIVNAVTTAYLQRGREDEFKQADLREQILSEERDRVKEELETDRKEQAALGASMGLATPADGAGNPYDADLAGLRAQLATAREARDVAAAQLESVTGQDPAHAGLHASADDLINSDPGLSAKKAAVNARRVVLESMMAGMTPSNPQYRQAQDEIADLDRALEAKTVEVRAQTERRIQDKLRTDLQRTADIESKINGQLAQATSKATSAGPKIQRASELAIDIQRLTARYTTVDEALNALELETSGPGMAHVPLPAVVPLSPDPNHRDLFFMAALPLGLVFGVVAAIVARMRDRRVYLGADLQHAIGFAPIAVLPAREDVSDRVIDEYVLRLAAGVESAYRTAGAKSFVVTAVSADTDTHALLQELASKLEDLRLRVLVIKAAELLVTSQETMEHQAATAAMIASGSAAPTIQAGEGIASAKLERMKGLYDIILIDAAPVLHSAETEYAARCADATILVAESAVTQTTELAAATALLSRLQVTGVGAVLEQVKLEQADDAFRNAVRVVEQRSLDAVSERKPLVARDTATYKPVEQVVPAHSARVPVSPVAAKPAPKTPKVMPAGEGLASTSPKPAAAAPVASRSPQRIVATSTPAAESLKPVHAPAEPLPLSEVIAPAASIHAPVAPAQPLAPAGAAQPAIFPPKPKVPDVPTPTPIAPQRLVTEATAPIADIHKPAAEAVPFPVLESPAPAASTKVCPPVDVPPMPLAPQPPAVAQGPQMVRRSFKTWSVSPEISPEESEQVTARPGVRKRFELLEDLAEAARATDTASSATGTDGFLSPEPLPQHPDVIRQPEPQRHAALQAASAKMQRVPLSAADLGKQAASDSQHVDDSHAVGRFIGQKDRIGAVPPYTRSKIRLAFKEQEVNSKTTWFSKLFRGDPPSTFKIIPDDVDEDDTPPEAQRLQWEQPPARLPEPVADGDPELSHLLNRIKTSGETKIAPRPKTVAVQPEPEVPAASIFPFVERRSAPRPIEIDEYRAAAAPHAAAPQPVVEEPIVVAQSPSTPPIAAEPEPFAWQTQAFALPIAPVNPTPTPFVPPVAPVPAAAPVPATASASGSSQFQRQSNDSRSYARPLRPLTFQQLAGSIEAEALHQQPLPTPVPQEVTSPDVKVEAPEPPAIAQPVSHAAHAVYVAPPAPPQVQVAEPPAPAQLQPIPVPPAETPSEHLVAARQPEPEPVAAVPAPVRHEPVVTSVNHTGMPMWPAKEPMVSSFPSAYRPAEVAAIAPPEAHLVAADVAAVDSDLVAPETVAAPEAAVFQPEPPPVREERPQRPSTIGPPPSARLSSFERFPIVPDPLTDPSPTHRPYRLETAASAITRPAAQEPTPQAPETPPAMAPAATVPPGTSFPPDHEARAQMLGRRKTDHPGGGSDVPGLTRRWKLLSQFEPVVTDPLPAHRKGYTRATDVNPLRQSDEG